MTNFGKLLERTLSTNGLSQSQFARETEVDIPSISRIVRGKQNPAHKVLRKILDNLPGRDEEEFTIGISPFERSQAELARAWLLDQLDIMPIDSSLIEIRIDDAENVPRGLDSSSAELLSKASHLMLRHPQFAQLIEQAVRTIEEVERPLMSFGRRNKLRSSESESGSDD